MDDSRIIDLYWRRDQEAIVQTERKYGGYCRHIAHNILTDRQDAEECLNDTWLRAWNSMPEERPGILSAFLGAITRNLSLDRYRRKYAKKRGEGQTPYILDELRDCAGKDEPAAYVERMELAESIGRFLEEMNVKNRVIFVRRYWYMDSITAIAERVCCSESRIKSSLFRSRKKLRAHLEREGWM